MAGIVAKAMGWPWYHNDWLTLLAHADLAVKIKGTMRESLHLFTIVVRRHIGLICLSSMFVTLLLMATYRPNPGLFSAESIFWVGEIPLPSTTQSDQERYFNWVTSEYVALSLTGLAQRNDFHEQVRWRMWLKGVRLSELQLADMISVRNRRSSVRFEVVHSDEALALKVADATADAFSKLADVAFPQLANSDLEVVRLDSFALSEVQANSLRSQLELPLRIGIGVLSGFLIALMVDNPKKVILDRRAISALNLVTVGEIPE